MNAALNFTVSPSTRLTTSIHKAPVPQSKIHSSMLMMPPIRSKDFRNRKDKIKMQPQTTEFAGYHYPTSQLQLLDRSPTATPVQTRSGSPTRGKVMPHTVEEAADFMSKLDDLMGPSFSSAPDGAEKRLGSTKPIAITEPDEKLVLKSVSATDGSAAISTSTKVKYLIVYFAFNLGLTLFNKAVMIAFPFPFLLTALHAAAGCLGTGMLYSYGTLKPKSLTLKDSLALYAFSLLYTVNIAVSNLSLSMVTIPFHQVVRATTPVFTVAIYRFYYSNTYSFDTYVSLVPVILGMGLATYGDYYATILGFLMTLLGAILAALKTVVTNRMQTAGLHLTAIELLYRLSPLAVLQSLTLAYFNGEFSGIEKFLFEQGNLSMKFAFIISVNAAMAFGLNVTSFSANKKAGALTMTVAANVKQILTVLLAVIFWRLNVGFINASGIVMTIIGGAWYGRVEMTSQKSGKPSHTADLEEGKVGRA
ncbi:UAA transporter [Sticta canariensis]|nr:UAA transporter [Sticta canariensis]